MSSVVPEEWVRIDLEEGVSALISGQSPNRKENRATGDAFGILKTTAIDWGRFDERQNQEVLDDYEPNNKHLVLENDILITKAGPAHRVGVVAQARNLRSNVLLSGKMAALRVNDRFTPDFLTYALCQEEAQNHLKANTTGMASSQTNFTHDALLRVPILSPPLPEQKKIASILTSVDEVIENTQKQIDKLQDLKKATMNELLTKGIGHTEFKNSELGQIPKSWEARQVQEIAKIIRGASPRPKGDPRYYGGSVPRLMGSDVTRDGKYVFPKTDFLTPEGAKLSRPMSKGGLTIVCSGTVGVPSILGVDACIHDGFLGLVDISNQCTTEFLYYAFLPLQEKFDSSATHGGVFTNLTTEILKEFVIAVPTLAEQQEIVRNISSLDEHLDAQINKLSQIQSLKKSLMQDLLTGKVRVTVN